MKRGKRVSSEDAALFRRAAGIDAPVVEDRVEPFRRRPAPRPRARGDAPPSEEPLASPWTPALAPGEALLHVRPGLQSKRVRRLRRGHTAPEAEVDLHGMTVAQAHAALARFLAESRALGLGCVRVVHGKGFGSRGGHAVLKSEVDRWLRLDPGVIAFASAPPAQGGTGAVHVLLTRE